MRLVATRKAEQSTSALDPWSVVHFGAGLGAGLINMRLSHALAAAVLYEVFEAVGQRTEPVQEFFAVSHPEHPANSVADVVVFGVGWWLGRKWNET